MSMIVAGSKSFGGWRSHQSNRFDNKKALREECFYNKTVSLFVGYFPMQHRSMFNYQRFSILIGTNRFLTKNSFSMYKCKPLFFSLLLILFVPPFFIQILYIKNQV